VRKRARVEIRSHDVSTSDVLVHINRVTIAEGPGQGIFEVVVAVKQTSVPQRVV